MQNFSLEFQEKVEDHKNYHIIYDYEAVGEIAFKCNGNGIHIYNVLVHEDYRKQVKFGKWLSKFPNVFVYKVLPEAVAYWERKEAIIVSEAIKPKFSDIIFDLDDITDYER